MSDSVSERSYVNLQGEKEVSIIHRIFRRRGKLICSKESLIISCT